MQTTSYAVLAGVRYDITDAEFDGFRTFTLLTNPAPSPATPSVPVDLSDTAVFQNTPEWNGNLALRYLHELQEWGSVLGTRYPAIRMARSSSASCARNTCAH